MKIIAFDHIVQIVPSLDSASQPFLNLGLNLTPPAKHKDVGTSNRVFFLGSDESHFYVELLAIHDIQEAEKAGRGYYISFLEKGGGAARLMLETDDIDRAVQELEAKGYPCDRTQVQRESDGSKICDVAVSRVETPACCAWGLIQYAVPRKERTEARKARGVFNHAFPALRMDHIACVAKSGVEGAAQFWTEVLGVPLVGEVKGKGLVIKQLGLNGSVLEVLAAETPEHPINQRPVGLLAMASVEVGKLEEVVQMAREKGFTLPDPAPGALPGTRTATISNDQLGGFALQLLEKI